MVRISGSAAILLAVFAHAAAAQQRPVPDSLPARGNEMVIVPIAHATLQIVYGSNVILVDPTIYGGYDGPHPGGVPRLDYGGLKPPTLVVVTDTHGDHFDEQAIATLRTPGTKVVVPAISGWQWSIADVIPLANGQMRTIDGVTVEAVAMYNLSRGPRSGQFFHVKGRGNGYVLTIGGKRVYVAGDTECTPEVRALKNIDIAFLPMNLPYTMTPEEAVECARSFRPGIVYPYHYRGQDPGAFEAALRGSGIEARRRDWYTPSAPQK